MSTTSQLAAGDIPSFAHVIEAHERIGDRLTAVEV